MEGCVEAGISVFQGHPGVLPEGATDLQVGMCSLFKAFCGGACLGGRGPHVESTGRQGWGLPRNGLSAGSTSSGCSIPPTLPSPHPHSLALHHRISLACTVAQMEVNLSKITC